MYQTIHEKIAVVGVYAQAQFTPRKFKWSSRTYVIDQITLTSDVKDGGVRKRIYSVLSGADFFRLEFNRETEVWWINLIG